jgi:hypothetical protein
MTGAIACAVALFLAAAPAAAQTPAVPPADAKPPLGPPDAKAAIDRLGSFDFQTRTEAARSIRRAEPAGIVPALIEAALGHADEYTRYRALVLAAGFAEATGSRSALAEPVAVLMRQVLRDRSDRLRAVAYQWFEYHPDAAVLPALIEALGSERSEFVRPALTRAIAAHGGDTRAADILTPLVFRGDDFFRGAVITALGDYKARYAVIQIAAVARLDGPLQDDAVTALGRIGDPSARATLAAVQAEAAREVQPSVSAALCLLGIDCNQRASYITETLRFAATHEGFQPLLRGAVHAAGVLAVAGQQELLEALIDAGIPSRDPARAAIALGIGTVAIRRPLAFLSLVEHRTDAREAMLLLQEAFDMLAEDFEEERFYVAIRRAFWEAPADSPRRRAAAAIIELTDF